MRLLVAKKKLANLVYIEKISQRVEDLIEKYDVETRTSSTSGFLYM